jgi:hypothetical protein
LTKNQVLENTIEEMKQRIEKYEGIMVKMETDNTNKEESIFQKESLYNICNLLCLNSFDFYSSIDKEPSS